MAGVTPICFSATASFSVGTILVVIGASTIGRVRSPFELPYAAVPVLFGLQQTIEGGLWLGLPTQSPTTHILAVCYLMFSHVLWPIFVPVAVWLLEPHAGTRRRIAASMAAGGMASLFFLYAITTTPVSATIKGAHIGYHLPHAHQEIVLTLYVAGACLAPLLSSHRTVRLFGIAIAASMVATYIAYVHWFASVWCFFAAVTSGIVFLHFSQREIPDPRSV